MRRREEEEKEDGWDVVAAVACGQQTSLVLVSMQVHTIPGR